MFAILGKCCFFPIVLKTRSQSIVGIIFLEIHINHKPLLQKTYINSLFSLANSIVIWWSHANSIMYISVINRLIYVIKFIKYLYETFEQ